jgi:hypothetical protein
MFQVNNADIYEGRGALDLPNTLERRRRFTLAIESDGYTTDLSDGRTWFQTQPEVVDQVRIPFENSTVALTFNLPMPYKSRTGFFNVSLRSFCIGNNNGNSVYDPTDPPDSYIPFQSNLIVNIKASSSYNCSIKDNKKTILEGLQPTLQSEYPGLVSKMEEVTGGGFPIGAVQLYNTNGDNHIEGQGAGMAEHSFNIPFIYPTKCDDFSVTIPDSAFNNNQLTITLTSPTHFWFENDLEVDTAVKTDVPLLINSTTPEDALTAPISSYKPFNLPYTAIISLEEC